MTVKLTTEGVVIPRELFGEFEEFDEADVVRENGKIVVTPKMKQDPIFAFGRNPVRTGIHDASVNLDHYLYGSRA